MTFDSINRHKVRDAVLGGLPVMRGGVAHTQLTWVAACVCPSESAMGVGAVHIAGQLPHRMALEVCHNLSEPRVMHALKAPSRGVVCC